MVFLFDRGLRLRGRDSEAFLIDQSVQIGGFSFHLWGSIFGSYVGRFFYLIKGLNLRRHNSDGILFDSGVQSSGVQIGWFSNRFGVSCSDKMIRETPILFGQFASRYKVRNYPSNRKRTIQLNNTTVQTSRSNAAFTTSLYNPHLSSNLTPLRQNTRNIRHRRTLEPALQLNRLPPTVLIRSML